MRGGVKRPPAARNGGEGPACGSQGERRPGESAPPHVALKGPSLKGSQRVSKGQRSLCQSPGPQPLRPPVSLAPLLRSLGPRALRGVVTIGGADPGAVQIPAAAARPTGECGPDSCVDRAGAGDIRCPSWLPFHGLSGAFLHTETEITLRPDRCPLAAGVAGRPGGGAGGGSGWKRRQQGRGGAGAAGAAAGAPVPAEGHRRCEHAPSSGGLRRDRLREDHSGVLGDHGRRRLPERHNSAHPVSP